MRRGFVLLLCLLLAGYSPYATRAASGHAPLAPNTTSSAPPGVRLPWVLRTVTVGGDPEALAVDTSTGRVFVANSGGNSVSILDARGGAVVRTVPVGKGPDGLALDARTHRVFVANGESNTVSVLNLDTGALVRTVAVGKVPSGVAVDVAAGRVLVTNGESDTVSLLDARTGALLGTTDVGIDPEDIAVDSQVHRAVVIDDGTIIANGIPLSLNSALATVCILDSRTGRLLATADGGSGAFAVAIDAHLHVGIVGNDNSVARIDLRSYQVALTPLGSVFDVKVNSRTDRAYLTNGLKEQRLSVLDVRTGAVVAALSVGPLPTYVGLDAFAGRVYIIDDSDAFKGPSTVAVVDTRSNRLLGQVLVGSFPSAIVVDARRGRVFVATGFASVTVIDGTRQ